LWLCCGSDIIVVDHVGEQWIFVVATEIATPRAWKMAERMLCAKSKYQESGNGFDPVTWESETERAGKERAAVAGGYSPDLRLLF